MTSTTSITPAQSTATGLDQYTLNAAYDLIATAAALGFPTPAPTGSTAVEVVIYGLDYDDPDVSLGIFTSKDAAVAALAGFVLERHDEMGEHAPWAEDIADEATTDAVAYDLAFGAARSAWLDDKSDQQIAESMFDESGYYLTDHTIKAAPARTW